MVILFTSFRSLWTLVAGDATTAYVRNILEPFKDVFGVVKSSRLPLERTTPLDIPILMD